MRVRNIAVYEHLKAVYARTIIDHEGDLYATDRRSWSIHKTQGIHSPTFLGSHNQSCRQFSSRTVTTWARVIAKPSGEAPAQVETLETHPQQVCTKREENLV